MKTLLVPFDFSPYSVAALRTAYKISQKSGAEILCVTVIPTELDWEFLSEKEKSKHPQIQQEYEEASELLPNFFKTIAPAKAPIQAIVKIGVPKDLILKVAHEFAPELIVLGAYGKGNEGSNFIGSTLQKVLRNAACPVLAVKEPVDGNVFRKIAFASSFTHEAKEAFSLIKPLVKLFRASVHLVYINTPDHFIDSVELQERMNQFVKGNEEVTFHPHTFNFQSVGLGLEKFGELNKVHLVALVTGHHEKIPSYQIGTTESLVYKSDLAVLSVKI